jgi:hypothetical protein
VQQFIDEVKSYSVPDHWENIVETLTGSEPFYIFNVTPESHEWKKIEANFKSTMPDSEILKIERI